MKREWVTALLGVAVLAWPATTGWTAEVVAWGGDYSADAGGVPAGLSNVAAVAAGGFHGLALHTDGTITGWGDNTDGQVSPPPGATGIVAISAGYFHSLALSGDGTVVAWGSGYGGLTNVPAGLSGVVAISAGGFHNLALKSNGAIVAWGESLMGQLNVPGDIPRAIAIAGGGTHSLALKPDGTVAAWGDNASAGQLDIPAGLSNVVAIAAGYYHSLALKSDGTVVAWGGNAEGQIAVPNGLTGVVAIAAGDYHSLALKSDGTVVTWGSNFGPGETFVPGGLGTALAVAGGNGFSLASVDTFSAGDAPLVLAPRFALGSTLAPLQLRVAARGQEVVFGATGLPSGLSIDPTTGLITGTPGAPGVFDTTLAASNSHGNAETTLTFYILDGSHPPPIGFATWSILDLLPEDRRGETDCNGPMDLPNLLAYAMGINPLEATAADLPHLSACPGFSDRMRFRYQQSTAAVEANLGISSSYNLRDWTAADIAWTNTVATSNGWQLIDSFVQLSDSNIFFLRLSAWSTNGVAK